MRKKIFRTTLMIFLCILMTLSQTMSVFATETAGTVTAAKYYLDPYDEAVSALNTISEEQDIYALVYLCDAYSVRKEADPYSDIAATLASGEQVLITGVSQDSGKNIWYEISYGYDEGIIKGYIEREYLAFSDERLKEWEGDYIKSSIRRMFSIRARATTSADIEQFPDSYKDLLYSLKTKHPDWTFVRMSTGLDWNQAVAAESEKGRNLIWASSANDAWKDGMYDKSWAYCSSGIVKYYMDPRNFFTDNLIFQFEQLTYNASYHSVESTQQILNGTFMSGNVAGTSQTYASVFTEVGKNNNVSPTLLASRVRQEQGTAGTSPMISGTYPGYEGLYNYYNIGASGQTTTAVLTSGLTKAREQGWTTRMLSLSGGASFLLNSYVKQGQDTLYLQKFDVDSRYNGVYWHQYMQNIAAPVQESKSTYTAYSKAGLIDSGSFVFRIPVYNNMPAYACLQPGTADTVTIDPTTVTNLPVDQTAVLTTYINGSQNSSVAMEFTSSNTSVATVSDTGVVTAVSPGSTTITGVRADNSSGSNSVTCSISVIKADIALEEENYPDLGEITYDPAVTLKDITLPFGYTWVNDSIVPIVENEGYSVVYNPDNSKYNTLTFTLPLAVKKATVNVSSLSVPTGLEGVAGAELRSIALPANYTWDNPEDTLPKKTGTYTFNASYCQDVDNYEVTSNIAISVSVICKMHEFGEWTGTHADCTQDGKLTRTCSICGEKETMTETALGHDYKSVVTKEATAKSDGIRTYTCSRCKDTYTEVIPATGASHEHSYTGVVTTEPTCTTAGVKTYTCSCGDSYTETIEPLGHDLVNGACTRCDYKVPSMPVHVHSYTQSSCTADCTHAGVTTYTCSCGDFYTESVSALGHEMVNGVCTRCGYKTAATVTATPTAKPTAKPTATPTAKPTATPTAKPTTAPTATVAATPAAKPTATPTTAPTAKPTATPTAKPTATPTAKPTATATAKPTTTAATPTAAPTAIPTTSSTAAKPTAKPTTVTTTTSASNQAAVTKAPATSQTATTVTAAPAQNTDTTKAASTDKKSETAVTPAKAEEELNVVRINMQNSSVLTAAKIGELSGDDKSLELAMPDNVTWSIDVASLDNVEELSIDMAVTLGEADIPEKILDTEIVDYPYELMTLAYDGPFIFDAVLSIPVKTEYKGMVANLLYYNPESKEFEFIGAAEVSKDGYAAFNMKHASDYAIVFSTISLEGKIADTTVTEDTSEEMTEVFNEQEETVFTNVNIWLIVAIAAFVIIAAALIIIFVSLHERQKEKEEEEEEKRIRKEKEQKKKALEEKKRLKKKKEDEYYLDEEDDEIK